MARGRRGAVDGLELNARKWDERAATYDEERYDYFRRMQSRVIEQLPLPMGGLHFLDAGCGTGWAVGEVARLNGFEGEFHGIDLSPRMIATAQTNHESDPSSRFAVAKVDSLPYPDEFFDLIICTNSFHHFPDPQAALQELARVLSKVGRLYILDTTTDTWVARLLNRWFQHREPEHVSFYSTVEYHRMFEAAGLTASDTIPIVTALKIPMLLHVAGKE